MTKSRNRKKHKIKVMQRKNERILKQNKFQKILKEIQKRNKDKENE